MLIIIASFFACSSKGTEVKKQTVIDQPIQKEVNDPGGITEYDISNKTSSQNPLVLQVVFTNTPVYLNPYMTAKRASFNLNRKFKLTINKIINIADKKSFDFAEVVLANKKYYVPIQFLGPIPIKQKMKDGNLLIGHEIVDKRNPLPLDYKPNDLVSMPEVYKANGYKNREMLMRKDALEAFIQMVNAAKRDGIEIKFISCFRSSLYQEIPYRRTIKQVGPKQKSSAKPGHSEHQLGTVGDITNREVNYRLTQSFSNTRAYNWVKLNANRYGIKISYTKENYKSKGYIWEPWHLRYWGK